MKKSWAKQKQSAFTIVELLIVIVVVAILATVSVVSYGGIQNRAENAARINEVQQAIKLLSAYKTINGSYPSTTTLGSIVCLGKGYSDQTGDGVPDCIYWLSGGFSSDTAFNSALETVGSLPVGSRKPIYIEYYDDYRTGPAYASSVQEVLYTLTGDSCPIGELSESHPGTVQCYVTMP
jgi:prepilin-type N-terminal cleavage/methylation domain-containing protein